MRGTRHSFPTSITDEFLHIVETVMKTTSDPRRALANLGLVVFPGASGLQIAQIAKLMGLTKSTIFAKLRSAGCDSEVACPSRVRAELRNFVGNDIKRWTLRTIPSGSRFQAYVDAHPEIVTGKDALPVRDPLVAPFDGIVELSQAVVIVDS
jgi:hypothetical protein